MKFVASDPNDLKIFSVDFKVEPEPRQAYRPAHRLPVRIN
jgi:hypothetical protein